MEKSNYCNKLYSIVLHITLVMSLMQLAAPIYKIFFSFRIDYLGLAVLFLISLFKIFKGDTEPFFKGIFDIIRKNKVLILLCVLYFAWDTINLIYAKDFSFVMDKYLIWSKLVVLIYFILVYVNINGEKMAERNAGFVLLNFGLSSVIISLAAIYGYFSYTDTFYVGMITPISDHNIFAVMVLIGTVTFFFYMMIFSKVCSILKVLIISFALSINIFTIYASASRSNTALLVGFAIFALIYAIYYLLKNRENLPRIIISYLVVAVITSLSIYSLLSYFEYFTDTNYNNLVNHARGITDVKVDANPDNEENNKEIVDIDKHMETITDGSGLALRKMIWKASIQWYMATDLKGKIIGGGASYQSDIFNDTENSINKPIVEHYKIKKGTKNWMGPHNFLLEDLLTGGMIKVIIVVLIMITVLCRLIYGLKYNFPIQCMLFALYLVLLGNLMMGGKFGLFGHRITWYILLMDIICTYGIKVDKKGELQ